jgi:hypothetical protein
MSDEPTDFGPGLFDSPGPFAYEFLADDLRDDLMHEAHLAAPDPGHPDREPHDLTSNEEQALFGAHTPGMGEWAPPVSGADSWMEPEETPPAGSDHETAPEASPVQAEEIEPPAAQPSRAPENPAVAQGSTESDAAVAGQEIAGVLLAAEQAARRIVERAQESAREQLAELSRRGQELEVEARRLAAWREQVGSVVQPMAAEIEGFRTELAEIPQRLSQVFASVAQHVPSIQKELAELVAALGSSSVSLAQESPEERERLAG